MEMGTSESSGEVIIREEERELFLIGVTNTATHGDVCGGGE